MKPVERKSKRQVTFINRRDGLIKKAKDLSILCDVDVGLIYSSHGKLHTFSSSNDSLQEIIEKYHNNMPNVSATIIKKEQDHSTIGTFSTVKDLLDGVERHLEDPDQLSRKDFTTLQDQLEAALLETRARKTHLMMNNVSNLKEKEKMLIEENRLLREQIAMNGDKMVERMAPSQSNTSDSKILLEAPSNIPVMHPGSPCYDSQKFKFGKV